MAKQELPSNFYFNVLKLNVRLIYSFLYIDKRLLARSGLHYHTWPLLGLILQEKGGRNDANRGKMYNKGSLQLLMDCCVPFFLALLGAKRPHCAKKASSDNEMSLLASRWVFESVIRKVWDRARTENGTFICSFRHWPPLLGAFAYKKLDHIIKCPF